MHDAGVCTRAVLFGKYTCHIVIRVPCVDDERQLGLAGRFDMDAQAFLLNLFGISGVMVIEPGFADADELGWSASATRSSTVARG